MPLKEQIAEYPVIKRAHRPPDTEEHSYLPRRPVGSKRNGAPNADGMSEEPRFSNSIRRYQPTNAIGTSKARLNMQAFLLMAIGTILLAVTLALLIVSYIAPAVQNWHDTSTYGYPRTTHARENTGHGDRAHPYSDYIGINLNCSLYVVELGEGDPTTQQPHLYAVAHFVGQHCDLIAITSITFADENGDGKLDMLVVANNTLYVLYNDGTMFKQSLK